MKRASIFLVTAFLFACGSSTPGRGGLGTTGAGTGSSGTGPALCSGPSPGLSNECTCTTMDTGTGLTGGSCNQSSIPNGVCCADLQWPGAGLSCQCSTYACRETSSDGSCECDLQSTGGPTFTCAAAQPSYTCCQHEHYKCECGPSVTCTITGDTVVTSCTKATAQCSSSSQQIVSTCQ